MPCGDSGYAPPKKRFLQPTPSVSGSHSKSATVRCTHATKSAAAEFHTEIKIFFLEISQIIQMVTERTIPASMV
jgi:hypothetical protein